MTRRRLIAGGFGLIACVAITTRCIAAPGTGPASTQPAKHVKLLAIGNSFSGNTTHFLKDIVAASGNQITFGHASIGGCSLQKHWNLAEAFEKDPADPNGRPYTSPRSKGKVSLRE